MVKEIKPDSGDDTDGPDYSKHFRLTMASLRHENDRVVAIVAAAYCEHWIQEVLRARMKGLSAKLQSRLFATGRPLGTADSRYDLARALNAIKQSTYDDLKRLATIRNRFAHFLEVENFDHDKVAHHVDNLETRRLEIADQSDALEEYMAEPRREKFIDNALDLCIKMHNAVNDIRLRELA